MCLVLSFMNTVFLYSTTFYSTISSHQDIWSQQSAQERVQTKVHQEQPGDPWQQPVQRSVLQLLIQIHRYSYVFTFLSVIFCVGSIFIVCFKFYCFLFFFCYPLQISRSITQSMGKVGIPSYSVMPRGSLLFTVWPFMTHYGLNPQKDCAAVWDVKLVQWHKKSPCKLTTTCCQVNNVMSPVPFACV